MSKVDRRAITVKTDTDMVILRSDKGIIKIMEDNGKFYATGHNGQPARIDATAEQIGESMKYNGFYYNEPVPVAEGKEEVQEEITIKRPILRKK